MVAQPPAITLRQVTVTVGADQKIPAQMKQGRRRFDGGSTAGIDCDRLIGELEAVTVGAVQNALPPVLRESVDGRQLIPNAARKEEPSPLNLLSVGQPNDEAFRPGLRAGRLDRAQLDGRVDRKLLARLLEELHRRRAIAREHSMRSR